jgi:trypsin
MKPAPNRSRGGCHAALLAALAALACLSFGTAAPAGAQPKIVGGSPAAEGELPWVAAIVRHARDGGGDWQRQFCGGSLIAPRVVVTAAHCMQGQRPADLQAVLGRARLSAVGGERIGISAIYIHPGYSDRTLINDVAVVRLARPSTGAPVSLTGPAETALWDAARPARVAGWGAIRESGPRSKRLLVAQIKVLAGRDCSRWSAYGSAFDPSTMLCAAAPVGGVDACQGDSGGPLVVSDGASRLIGVVSWGAGYARPGYPGVYSHLGAPAINGWVREMAARTGPARAAPDTWIRGRHRRTHRLRPSFGLRARGAVRGFECRFDRGRFRPCRRSARPKRALRPGIHRLSARAVGVGGRRDPSPARLRFRVVA